MHQPFGDDFLPPVVHVEGYFDEEQQITCLGNATRQDNGMYRVLMNYWGSLVVAEVSLTSYGRRY